MATISYERAAPADLPAARNLLSDCALPVVDVHQHWEHFVTAKDGADLVGVAGLEFLGRTALLRSFAVAPRYRSHGVGTALYRRVLAHAHLRGVTTLYLLTLSAQDYFSKLGFQAVVRNAVPDEVQATAEFRNLCPSTAVCLAKQIGGTVRYFPSDTLELRPDVPGARMWGVRLVNTLLTYFEVEPNSRFERHAHVSEQITMVLDGELYFEVDDDVVRVAKGEVIALPTNVPHAVFTAHLGAKALDAWSPVLEKYRE
jgi:amino-acid N-acetyltransferase